MPRIPFTDLASAPEFKSLPVEEQQKVSENYWNEVAAEQPGSAEIYRGMGEASKALLETKAKRADALPVQRRFLDADVQNLAFDLSLADELARGRMTPDSYAEALKVRDAERAERQVQLDKTRDLFSDDPAKQKALAIRLDGLEQTAITGGVFGSSPMKNLADLAADVLTFNLDPDDGMVSSSRDAYAALKEQTAKDYGLEPDEVEDLVKHRLGFQEKPVSLDATGNPFIKPEILAQGPDAVRDAILNSDLPWREKQRMTEQGDLNERMEGYYKATIEGVKKNHPELARLTGVDKIDDPRNGFELLMSDLNRGFGEKFASGFTAYTFGVAEQIAPAVSYLDPNVRIAAANEGRDPEQAAQDAANKTRRPMNFARRAQESVNQLSQEFYKNQGTLWGVDASAYGQGAGSVLSAVGLGMLTGGASLPMTAARVKTMGPSALRMLNGANSVMRASPSIGLAMAMTGTSTYDNAIKSGKSEEEAGELATLAGATEGVITGTFSFLGLGGTEAVGEQLFGTAARTAVKESAKNVVRNFGGKLVKGVSAEVFEEVSIAAFDSATVQARINPNMTVEDFMETLRETALVTLVVSGPTIGGGALRKSLSEKATYEQTTEEIKLRADLNLADAADPLRDRLRREGGVGTPLGERLRRPATQPSQANLPPAGQGPADTAQDGGAPAPGAPQAVAPGGTEPVVGTEPVAAEAVPGVQSGVAADPMLVPADAGVTPATVEDQKALEDAAYADADTWDRANRGQRSDEWFYGGNANMDAIQGYRDSEVAGGDQLAAHGMAKESTLSGGIRNLANLLRNGLDPNRRGGRLDTAPLATSNSMASGGQTAGGTAYKDGPFTLVARPGQEPGRGLSGDLSGLGAVIVNQANAAQVESIRKMVQSIRPDVLVGTASELGAITRQLLNPTTTIQTTPAAEAAPADLTRNAAALVYDLRSPDTGAALDLDDIEMALDNADRAASKGREIDWSRDTTWLPNLPTATVGVAKDLLSTPEGRQAVRQVVEARRTEDQTTTNETAPVQTTPADAGVGVQQPTLAAALGGGLQRTNGSGIVILSDGSRLNTNPLSRQVVNGEFMDLQGNSYPESAIVEVLDDSGTSIWKKAVQITTTTPDEAAPAPPAPVGEPAAAPAAEPEPDRGTVFETLRERDPETKQVDTESPKFKELVAELKNNRVAEAAGKMEQAKADIAGRRTAIEQDRKDRNNARLKRNREKIKARPLDEHRKKIIELTRDSATGKSVNPDQEVKLREWLRARGYDASIKKKGWLDSLVGPVVPLRVDKRERMDALRASLTPEVRAVLEAIYRKPEKGKEQIPIIEAFADTTIGAAILDNKLRSPKWYKDQGLSVPGEYDALKGKKIPAHLQNRLFSPKGLEPDKLAKAIAADSEAEGGSLDPSVEDIWQAVLDLADGKVTTEEDADSYYEKKLQEAEDREIAFAEQQLEAMQGEVQTVDITEVREGDKFTIGGVEYASTTVEDVDGRTDRFTLRGDGPFNGTEVTEDFFTESVTPTEGSLAGVDPAEVEAFRIAQADPELFAAEPAPEPQAQTPPAETPQPVGVEPAATVPAQTPPVEPTPAPVEELEDPDLVGMQNAATDRRRQRAGLPPRFAPARLSNQAAWDLAMAKINRDPAAGRDLVNELRKSPRSLNPVETALYTHELLVREQALDDAYSAYNKDQNPDTETAMRLASAAVAEAILTAERIGTIEGRALQARKILVHQDFSIGRAVAKMTAANGGKELSKDQMKEVAELHKKMQELQTELAAAQEQIAKEEAQRIHVTVVSDYKKGLKEAKSRGEKGPGFIDRQAEAALARIKARKQEGRLNSLPLDELLDHAIVGVRYLKNGLVSIGEFTTQLVKDFGRKVLPFANDIFAKSQELYTSAAPSSKVKSREDVLEDIDPEAPLNDKAIFQLVRHYINEGVDGFEPVMQAVLTDLREFYPDLTLREVHDAYSKYGQTRVPSREEDLKLAREYKELSRLQSQLEDAQRGLAPLKTGLQREKATQRVRDLTKAVKDTMRRLNIRPTTEENQLRSSFDAIKTRLRNEYEDLDTAIRKGEARKERSPQTFTPAEEAELKALRQRRDDRKADYEAIFKKKGLTDEQRIERAERLLDRRIAEERDMLEKGILKRNREMLMGPFSPALKSRKETLDKLKAERRELQKAARPKTPELEKKYQRDLASLERRIKEEEKLLAEGRTARERDFKMGRWTPEMAEMQARLDAFRDARRELAESRKPEKDEAAAAYERATKAIETSIKRYQDILAGKAKADPGKKFTVDAEMTALLDQRDALRDAAAALRAMDPARIDKRKQAVLKALDRSIVEITRKIQDGDLSTKGRTDFFASDPDVVKIRAARDLLNKTLAAMRKDALPKRSPEEIRNSRDQKLIENKITKLRDRLARGDYSPKPKLPPPDYTGRDALLTQKKKLESEFNIKVLELALANRSRGRKIFDNTLDVVFGVTRAMLTSFDAGAFGRQAGLVNFMRPGLAIKNFPANFAFSEKAATRYETAMEADPRWARANAAGLALTSWRPGSSLTDMEEVYRSRIAKKIPGVAASERAYVTYLNQVRFSYFNALMETLPATHQTEENMKFLSRHVNMMTGRGKMGPKMEGAAAALASLFFSPKYWWSRLQVLGNLAYVPLDAMTGFNLGAKETRVARKIVAVEYARLLASLGVVFSLLAFAKDAFGWEEFSIGTDPRSSDFGKLRIGDTRIDFMAGLLQNVVFISRFVTGKKTTGSGKSVPISGNIERKFGQNRFTETIRFLRTKLSPAAGSIVNFMDEQDVVGNKFTPETEILGSYIPMQVAETYSAMRELGIAPGAAAGLLSFIGIGASTYGGEEAFVMERDILTGRVLEPFGITPGTFFIDQSRYEKEAKEKGWVIPKSKGLPTF